MDSKTHTCTSIMLSAVSGLVSSLIVITIITGIPPVLTGLIPYITLITALSAALGYFVRVKSHLFQIIMGSLSAILCCLLLLVLVISNI